MMNTNIIDLEDLANVVGGQSYDSYDLFQVYADYL